MWIALKSWYLWYSEQLFIRFFSCERVVNCSQKLISLIFGTTPRLLLRWPLCCELLSKVDIFDIRNNMDGIEVCQDLLWIALKSWYLWYSEQLTFSIVILYHVVNCSQKLISLIFGTTWILWSYLPNLLWIALKSWYLWYSEQH